MVLSPIFRSLWRVHVEGAELLPSEGPAILCPNHVAAIDSFMLPLTLSRRITFVGKSEYLDDWKTRRLFPALGMIPIDRTGGDAAQAALDTAARVLEAGEFFGIYPEGTRSRDGVLHKGKTGPARLAVRTGAPIVPVGIIGTRELQPPDRSVPVPFRPVEVRFGTPIDVAARCAGPSDHVGLRAITDELMFEIASLSGQDYVNEYATRPTAEDRPSSTTVLATAA
jgi:1-acyl-sn-glycerol-3-phosphate acyltransferase